MRPGDIRTGVFRLALSLAIVGGIFGTSLHSAERRPQTLTFDQRLVAQRAVEEVLWRHRIWPAQNPGPKPPLHSVMPESVVRAKVEDTLELSRALETYWSRPVTPDQLQAEMDRIARDTRQPEVLREIYDALDDDPELIAECLARPTLVDRLAHNWYSRDERFHSELRRRALEALAADPRVEGMRSLGGEYHETAWRKDASATGASQRAPTGVASAAIPLEPVEWDAMLGRLSSRFAPLSPAGPSLGIPRAIGAERQTARGDAALAIPIGSLSALREDDDSFSVVAVLARDEAGITVATVSWKKTPFDSWWVRARRALPAEIATAGAVYTLAPPQANACAPDTWSPTHWELEPRAYHTAVWTGSEMIVWGGYHGVYDLTGGRYNPATDSWTATSQTGAPVDNEGNTAVWTGTEMIVWGGNYTAVGGRYNPTSDSWIPTSTGTNVPPARTYHTAVWTGTEMIVWGGFSGSSYLNDGGRYKPATDTWTATSTGANVPTARYNHTAVWSGTEMIVWGGIDGGNLVNTGGRYRPSTNTWTAMSTGANLPTARQGQTAVWTGTQMVVWGGADTSGVANTGGRYTPGSNSWTPTSVGASVPSARIAHTIVWTGSEMIVWGGYGSGGVLGDGGRYTPGSNSWAAVSSGPNAPAPRNYHTAVWTGSEMIVWGGTDSSGIPLDPGARYSPSTDTWVTVTSTLPTERAQHTAVWTGSEMIVWGGSELYSNAVSSGARYAAATDSWHSTNAGPSVPGGRILHTAVWTGSEMIVWGGYSGSTYINTGGRYNPATNSWTATSGSGSVPSSRGYHTAVWTGTEMIIWGGFDVSSSFFDTGGRYNSTTNSWTATSTTGAPSPRGFHVAVWAGSSMVVWGGIDSQVYLTTGGRYDPAVDAWTPTSTTNTPSARSSGTAVWTGTQMIVWGGYDGTPFANTGGRYDPILDTWTSTGTGANVPAGREYCTAVWTGSEMIVWDGYGASSFEATGGRYVPATDAWMTMSDTGKPTGPRVFHTAVATDREMIVWGGQFNYPGSGPDARTGARYCFACSLVTPAIVSPLTVAKLSGGTARLSWPGVAQAGSYDLVRGSLALLASSGGNFSVATNTCLAKNLTATAVDDAGTPVSDGFWYLVRARNCAGPGSYDSGASSQVGLRDSEIAVSGVACP